MITSPKGLEMIQYITPIYAKSGIEQAIYEAIGSEFDNAEELAQEVLLQLFPQTATWGLIFWEERLKLLTNTNEDIERRRRKVIARLQTRCPVTPERMATILSNYTGADIRIPEYLDSKFEVWFITKAGINGHFNEIIKEIDRIKPSHTSYKFIINYLSEYIIQEVFNKWLSEPISLCGTINTSGNEFIQNSGWSFKEEVIGIVITAESDEFTVASETTFIIGDGKTLTKALSLGINKYPSDEFKQSAEQNFINGVDGKSINVTLSDGVSRLYSELIPRAAQDIYVKEVAK